ncbi:MAG TPA: diiron oxygenase, partial [Polyangiaceae bacterium]
TSDFLADEVHHVELASRLLMQLGGAAPRSFDASRLAPTTTPGLTPLQRANELVVRIGCVAETFASETAVPMMRETTHPLVRGVYQTILRDEARHCRLAGLYFDWAGDRLDQDERRRLGVVAVAALGMYAPLWRSVTPSVPREGAPLVSPASGSEWSPAEIHELGWIEPERYVPLARGAVTDAIVPALRALGLDLPEAELAALLAD